MTSIIFSFIGFLMTPISYLCLHFLCTLCLTFDIKNQFPDLLQGLFPTFTLSLAVLLWYILRHSFQEVSVHIYWVPDTVVGTGEMTVNKTNNILSFVEFFFPPGIFVQFQGIYYPISTGTHPNRFGTHVKWRDCFISFSFFFIIPCVLCYILKKILFWMGFSNIYL